VVAVVVVLILPLEHLMAVKHFTVEEAVVAVSAVAPPEQVAHLFMVAQVAQEALA
jgi:hypothetical protein